METKLGVVRVDHEGVEVTWKRLRDSSLRCEWPSRNAFAVSKHAKCGGKVEWQFVAHSDPSLPYFVCQAHFDELNAGVVRDDYNV